MGSDPAALQQPLSSAGAEYSALICPLGPLQAQFCLAEVQGGSSVS